MSKTQYSAIGKYVNSPKQFHELLHDDPEPQDFVVRGGNGGIELDPRIDTNIAQAIKLVVYQTLSMGREYPKFEQVVNGVRVQVYQLI
jgi:hypothetical protein